MEGESYDYRDDNALCLPVGFFSGAIAGTFADLADLHLYRDGHRTGDWHFHQ
jgi:hypothetical protein